MRLLVANFFPAIAPPRSGGEQRYFYLYKHLSRWHDVTLLSANYADKPVELVEHSPSFREYRVPKPAVSNHLHWELFADGIGDECSGLVVAIAGQGESLFRTRFRELLAYADAVVHECPFTLPYDETAFTDGKPRVYASYNVEHRLAAQMFKGASGESGARFIRYLESLLVARADLVLATSDEERHQFAADFGIDAARIRLAPNGYEPMEQHEAAAGERRPFVVFLGSGHPPNVEAARYIVDVLAPALPQLEFHVMGAVCGKLGGGAPSNVKLLGFVEEGVMRAQLRECAAAINPLSTGAGTNLKMLQYMEAGAPILTTPVGARGLDLVDGLEAYVREASDFAGMLAPLAETPSAWTAVGEGGRRKAEAEYSWPRIAQHVDEALRTLPLTVSRGARRRLLCVNDHPVTARAGGGQVRIHELLAQLGRDFDVELLCLGDERVARDASIAPAARQRVFPKTDAHRAAERAADEGCATSVRDIVAAEWVKANEPFMAAFQSALPHAAAVVFEHPYLAPLLDLVPPAMPVVYASQNVEEELKAGLHASRRAGQEWIARTAALERRLCERANLIVAVCEDDARRFRQRYPAAHVLVVENGVEVPGAHALARPAAAGKSAIFIGSAHPPNIEAARFIIDTLAAQLPDATFHIVGSVCDAVGSGPVPGNVVLHGMVDADRKRELLASATIAVNPMAQGGGSSLKVPDFLSVGLPLVSTLVGARGFGFETGRHFVAADPAGFAATVRRLLEDAPLRQDLSRAGRAAVRRLGWPVVGAKYRRALRRLVRRRAAAKPRVLIATYRLLEPPPGGAESYLNHLIAAWGALPDVGIDVAAVDVGSIQDHWHFSARYGAPPGGAKPAGIANLFRFPVDALSPDAFDKSRALHGLWMRESVAQWHDLFRLVDRPVVLGGWNWPERSGGPPWRWSGLRAQVGVTEGFDAIRIDGTSPGAREVGLESPLGRTSSHVEGAFSIEAPLDGTRQIVELQVDEALVTTDDPRELGVAVQGIVLRRDGAWHALDLANDGEQVVRARDAQAWVDSLMAVTTDREPAEDALFVEVRGPHSRAMAEWLERHAADYDAIVVQGVPFAPVAWVPQIARDAGVPVALLPHYHVEDRYYHWRAYYDAFRDADGSFVFPASIKPRFFDRLDAVSWPVAGGGLTLAEFTGENLRRCEAIFRETHRGERPFVLVLGRKTAGKRYQLVLEAALGADFDVVMVGPDDDGLPVGQPNLHYYGARPRDFIVGALAACACLANMSESESFGIVLLEAWAAGRPVVAQRRCVAFRDLVIDGENGVLVETPAEVNAAVRAYVADPARAREHGERGRELAVRYGWDAIARDVDAIVRRELLAPLADPSTTPRAEGFDAATFVKEAVAETMGLASSDAMHDPDFGAFLRWSGPEVRCVLDIGANRGQSIVSLRRAFPRARIHSFEANPVLHPVLHEVARRLEANVDIHECGLGRDDGELSLFVPWAAGRPWLEESSTLRENFEKPWVAQRFAERGGLRLQPILARIVRGDSLALDPQVVKIDVEGAEAIVIRGLEDTIRRSRPVLLVENSDFQAVTATLEGWGYRAYRWDQARGVLVTFHGECTNAFYVHETQMARPPVPIAEDANA